VTTAATVLCDVAGSLTKPVAVALYTGGHPEIVEAVLEAQEMLLKAGIPVYPGVEAASKAIDKLIRYHELAERQ
jgi:acyl-CoA synthetase (NDP forming)